MNHHKENLTTLLQNFFMLNKLDQSVLKYKMQLKDIYKIKLDLVSVIKQTEALFKEIEQLPFNQKEQVQTQGNDNDILHASSSNLNIKKDRVNIARPKTPDLNSNHYKTAMNIKSATKELQQQQQQQLKDNSIEEMTKTFTSSTTMKKQQTNANYKEYDRAPTPTIIQKRNKNDINKTYTNVNKSIDLTASGAIESVVNPSTIAKNVKLTTNNNNTNNRRSSGNQPAVQLPQSIKNKKKFERTITPVHNKNSKKTNKQNNCFNIEDSKEDLLSITQKHEKALYEYILQRKASYYKIKFSSPIIQALQLCIRSNYLSFKEKYSFIISKNKELYTLNKDLIHEQLLLIKVITEKRISELKEQISKYDINIIEKKFSPSKTATNGLNFVTKEEEGNLWKKEQPKQIMNIFKSMYLMFNESYDLINEDQLIQAFITQITPKHGCETLKALLVNKLGKTIESSPESIMKLIQFSNENPTLFSATELIKINRSVSYMNFILKEYFDYITFKLPDGIYIYTIRLISMEKDALQAKVDSLNVLL